MAGDVYTEAARDLRSMVDMSRWLCGCYSCSGPREIGAHTIATPDKPRPTPSSCLAPTLLQSLLNTVGKRALRKVAEQQP